MATNMEPTPSGINRLPLDCLLHIFGHIPLKSLLSLRRVSPTWNSAIIYICAHKKRLKLAPYSPPASLSKSDFDLYWIDDLTRYLMDRTENCHESLHFSIDQLTAQSTSALARLFTGLTELVVHYDCGQILRPYHTKIEALVRHFASSSPNLVALSFHLTHSSNNTYPQKCDMLSTLCNIASNITTTRLPHLQQLDLCTEGNFCPYLSLYSTLAIEYRTKAYDHTLAQLKRFSLGYNSPRWDTQSTLAKLGPGLVSLSLSLTNRTNFEPLIRLENVKFSASLTHLRLRMLNEASNHEFFRALCDHFKALKFVQIQLLDAYNGFSTDFDHQWIGPLSVLKQLYELRLHDFAFSVNFDNSPSLVRMKTLKKLTLCKRDLVSSELFDADAFCRTLATLFTNLEDLVLVCRPFLGDLNEDTRAQQVEQQIRQNLIHFSHLRSTVLDFTAPEMN